MITPPLSVVKPGTVALRISEPRLAGGKQVVQRFDEHINAVVVAQVRVLREAQRGVSMLGNTEPIVNNAALQDRDECGFTSGHAAGC